MQGEHPAAAGQASEYLSEVKQEAVGKGGGSIA